MRKSVRIITSKENRIQLTKIFNCLISLGDMNLLTDSQYSHNSLLAMRKDWNLFVDFCSSKGVCPLPASTTAIRLFLQQESNHRKYATIKRYVVTLSLVHKLLAYPDPTSSTVVRTLLAQLRIEKKQDATVTTAFSRNHLEKLTQKLNHSTHPVDIRNLAIYYLMFECMLKRSELKQLFYEQLVVDENTIHLQMGNERYTLSDSAYKFIDNWLQLRGHISGALFSAIDKHGNLSRMPLDDSSIYRILRTASDKLKLNVQFSGQSLRVGAVADMADKGVKVKDIQHYGRWQSAAMPYQYIGNRIQAAAERMVFKTFKPWD